MSASRFKIIASTASKIAITDQFDYYRDRENLALAERWEAAVCTALDSLRTMSERGAPCRFRHPRLQDMRWIMVRGFPFRIFYIVDLETVAVRIVHILHAKRDIERVLTAEADDPLKAE